MKTADINDGEFRSAVEAIDAGNIAVLSILINENPDLLTKRLDTPDAQGYFKDPYLLWFVADNPIRNATLAANIAKITQFIIENLKQFAEESLQYQLDYALELVITGKTVRDCNVQIELIDVLMNAGAKPGNALAALANGNKDAAMHLLDRGAELTLPVAVGLRDFDEISRLFPLASSSEKTTALTVATFYGMADLVSLLFEKGVNVNGELDKSGFHTHGTPLHQAVSSGSLDTVKLLVEAGADLAAKDKIYGGTPLAWANYLQRDEQTNDPLRKKYKAIEQYLKAVDANSYKPE